MAQNAYGLRSKADGQPALYILAHEAKKTRAQLLLRWPRSVAFSLSSARYLSLTMDHVSVISENIKIHHILQALDSFAHLFVAYSMGLKFSHGNITGPQIYRIP